MTSLTSHPHPLPKNFKLSYILEVAEIYACPKYNIKLANSFEIVKIPKSRQIICMSTEGPIIILAQ